jgi:hypothetical protein
MPSAPLQRGRYALRLTVSRIVVKQIKASPIRNPLASPKMKIIQRHWL